MDSKTFSKATYSVYMCKVYICKDFQFKKFYWQIKICTCPSHISMRGVLLVAFSSLKWNSFPSKKFQGRHMFHGIGAPHTSLANTAVSTPDINREARWIPRGNTLGSCKANIIFFFKSSSYNIQILFCALLNQNKNLL